ncbi:uncharacterized protein ColSpa_05816 [Colletotrichum spaethianum]|uniref:Uncharacterized protein n=1 Tax=Colletotrichum spaethianum TaxID=700344 RepID=A0AA37P0H8_9PEZI|nr:uncharacterized protein ColSpa_05816 [Colletotrichum spaethianum]GKT45635.1 hypothetical protein ColSpa_05816 [Colletotrichum spaethianum]
MHCPQPLLAVLSLCLFSSNVVRADDTTTVPIYLPHYDAKSWSQLRGSVISSVRWPLELPRPSFLGAVAVI